jgi:hypothetical protein
MDKKSMPNLGLRMDQFLSVQMFGRSEEASIK